MGKTDKKYQIKPNKETSWREKDEVGGYRPNICILLALRLMTTPPQVWIRGQRAVNLANSARVVLAGLDIALQ